jgi:hypothetical protein
MAKLKGKTLESLLAIGVNESARSRLPTRRLGSRKRKRHARETDGIAPLSASPQPSRASFGGCLA